MPSFGDITVRVTDSDGKELDEWGIQHLRRQNKVSVYIKSSTNMGFMLSVQPKIPFPDPDLPNFANKDSKMQVCNEMHKNIQSQVTASTSKKAPSTNGNSKKNSTYQRTGSDFESLDSNSKRTGHSDENTGFSSSAHPQAKNSAPPFHLLASMFLDGREKAERRVVIHLDPNHEEFRGPDGKVMIRSRLVRGRDGTLNEHSWVFKEVGIETLLNKMFICGGQDSTEDLEERSEDGLIDAMNGAKLGAETNLSQDEKSNVGKISVVIQRVILGENWEQPHYRPGYQEGDADDVEMNGMKNGITHTAGHQHSLVLHSSTIRVVHFTPYVRGEKPYATFQFFYRSQQTLEKFGFPGFPCLNNRSATTRRCLQDRMSNNTPLSITHRLPSSKPNEGSFLKKTRENTVTRTEPKHQFSGSYRESKALIKITYSKPLANQTESTSRGSTRYSLRSAQTSPRKVPAQALQPLKRSGKEVLGTENTSMFKNGLVAVLGPHPAFSAPSVPKSTLINCRTPYNGAAFMGPGSSSSASFMSKDPKVGSKPIVFKISSGKLRALETNTPSQIGENSKKQFPRRSHEGDANNDGDESDAETILDEMNEPDKDDLLESEGLPSLEQDDQGLQTELADLSIIGKKRRLSDRLDNPTTAKPSAGANCAPLLQQEVKMEDSTCSVIAVLSAVVEENKAEDDILDPTKPEAKRTKLSPESN